MERKETHKQKIIRFLRSSDWVCSTYFQENFIPEFRSEIARMRKHEGYGIIDEACLGKCGKAHNSKGLKRWKLVSEPHQNIPLLTRSNERKTESRYQGKEVVKSFPSGGKSGECCASQKYFQVCSKECLAYKAKIAPLTNQLSF